jgi:S-disulfanyl-L-cysteine oxidoreductase SoxD
MSMGSARRLAATTLLVLAGATGPAPAADPDAGGPGLGRPVRAESAARVNLNVYPDGRGLPAGRGDAVAGRALFAAQCAACHGPAGRGGSAEELAGGTEPLTSEYPDRTIGLYWPHATTLFDLIRRAKPMTAPGRLSADEVYALTAYLLHENGLIGERDTMDATTLPKVRMPNREGFTPVDAKLPR